MREVRPDGGVVVGDDGSPGAADAVRFAAAEARRRGVALHVVRAWSIVSAERPADVPVGIVPSLTELAESTETAERAHLDDLLGPDAGAEVHVCHGPSAQALIAASETADVVVVGSRGRGGFANLALGSVAEQCVRHADCPVIVVRGRV